jgi:hypothetical protein
VNVLIPILRVALGNIIRDKAGIEPWCRRARLDEEGHGGVRLSIYHSDYGASFWTGTAGSDGRQGGIV